MAASPRVSIVLSDRSWILERLGLEIQSRVERVDLNDRADPSADINYYITFACRREPTATIEIGLFTHMEREPKLKDLFISSARDFSASVCMSSMYQDILRANGVENTVLISPGVDRDHFQAKLRVGVVGRTYHTGRKGEGLIAQLMDMEGIDWHFTGEGWPLPGKHLQDHQLPDFYRSMDYILVPALYEGGPMCVPEALSVGTPVISSDVGWVRDFPHIPFENGNASDLRRVLNELLQVKQGLRDTTERYTWDAYASAHDQLFRRLYKSKATSAAVVKSSGSEKNIHTSPVRLLLHGNEAMTKGGPSLRVPRTADALNKLGVPARHGTFRSAREVEEPLVHLFNVWQPSTALAAARRLKEAGKSIVFSPIYLDLSERDFWQSELPSRLVVDEEAELARGYLEALAHTAGRGRLSEPVPGYHAAVREIIRLADQVIFLSEVEREALARVGVVVDDDRAHIIRNPVDVAKWSSADPEMFRQSHLSQLRDDEPYVVCVGRIEARKNQLMLARAVRDLNLKLVLVGHEGDAQYAEQIRKVGGASVLMTGRLDNEGGMISSAIAGAAVFSLPSWSEGASLAVLEAAAVGANMVLSDRSSEREYFGRLAEYCVPGELKSVRNAIKRAVAKKDNAKRRARLRALVSEKNSWEKYAKDTAAVYAKCLESGSVEKAELSIARRSSKYVIDITTLAHHKGRMTGISRVEENLAREFVRGKKTDPTFICWNDTIRRFITVPPRFAKLDQAYKFRQLFDNKIEAAPVEIPKNASLVVPGSAWMQNSRYVSGLEELKAKAGCSFIPIIYDLIPLKFPFWFADGYAVKFKSNFFRLARISDHILTDSRSCASDVEAILAAAGESVPPVHPIRLGDPVFSQCSNLTTAVEDDEVCSRFFRKKFVLAVGAIHTRKNYDMLYRVWSRFSDEGKLRDLHLVIVGGAAWNGRAFSDAVAQDNRVNKNIHIVDGIDDRMLGWLYQNCLFTAFPSHYEGWGLPVAESLVCGKLCLASSASSVPEIAPDLVEHIDPEDFVDWYTKIQFYATSTAAREVKEAAIRAAYRPVKWSETARDVTRVALQKRPTKGLHPLLAGQLVEAREGAEALNISFDAGWHNGEAWGRWAQSDKARLTVNASNCVRQDKHHIRVLLNLKARLISGRHEFEIRIPSGDILFRSKVTQKHFPEQLLLSVPVSNIASDGSLTLEVLLPSFPESTSSSQAKSVRNLGVGLISLCLLDAEWSNPLQRMANSEAWIDGESSSRVRLSDRRHWELVGNGLRYLNAWGIGSREGAIELHLPLLPTANSQEILIMCRPIATQTSPVEAVFRINGSSVHQARYDDDAPVQLRVVVPSDVISRSTPVVLSVEMDSLFTPKDLGLGSSDEVAGLGVFEVFITPLAEEY